MSLRRRWPAILTLAVAVGACGAAMSAAAESPYQPAGVPPTPQLTQPPYHGPTCKVPRLIGMTLPEVKRSFHRTTSKCYLGTVRGDRRGVVVRQSPKPRLIFRTRTAIDVTLRVRR